VTKYFLIDPNLEVRLSHSILRFDLKKNREVKRIGLESSRD